MSLINVPSDGNCLLHSIALAFLDPSNATEEFERRFELLFGTGYEDECKSLYQQFAVNAIEANLYKHITSNQIWKILIDKFRLNLVEFMKFQSHILTNSVIAGGYIPNNDDFYNTDSFTKYLKFISDSHVWLGSLEIRTASLMLDCCIAVQQENKLIATFNPQSSIILILEFLKEDKHYNFILKCSPISKQKRKLPMTETEFNKISGSSDLDEVPQVKRTKLDESIQPYESSGVKRALHGTVYQLELLMLFLLRIEKLTEIFFLATEMDFADKFDDVVLKYKMTGNTKYKWRFLQAKHKQNPTKHKITIKELKSPNDDDFSLQKYYVSFYKIKTNECFQDAELEDFCILTNTTFDLEIKEKDRKDIRQLKEKWRRLFSEAGDLQNDPILSVDGEAPKEIKFKTDPPQLEDVSNMMKSALQLAITTGSKKRNQNIQLLQKSEMIPLKIINEIKSLNIDDFSDSILETILNIEEKVSRFDKNTSRDFFFKLVDDILEVNVAPKLNIIKQDLKIKRSITFQEKETFLKQLVTNLNDYLKSKTDIKDWLQFSSQGDDKTKIKDLKEALENFHIYFPEFISKLRFITDYPNVDNLSTLISEEIGLDENLLSPDLFAHSFKKVMLDWLKKKDSIFLSNLQSDDIRNEIRNKIHTLMVAGLSKAYPEELNNYSISFNHTINVLKFLKNDKVPILHLISTKPLLTSIKLLKTLNDVGTSEEFRWLTREDSFIFIKLNMMLLSGIQEIAVHSFSSDLRSQNLLIIECVSRTNKIIKYTTLFNKLRNQIKDGNNKKIILIGPEDDIFIKKFKASRNIQMESFEDRTYFSHLDQMSQEKILFRQLKLQGKDILLRDILNDVKADELIDASFLIKLIKNKPIMIGEVLKPYLKYNDQYYILRKLQFQKLKISIFSSGMYLFVSNITEEQFINLRVKRENLCRFEDYVPLKHIIFTESDDLIETQRYFYELCRKKTQQSIHWIVFNAGYLEWKSSRGNVTKILEYLDDECRSILYENSFEMDYSSSSDEKYGSRRVGSEISLDEDDVLGFKIPENLVIIADNPGMGKSTLLASVSSKIKENNPHWWVSVINFNDFTDESQSQSLKNIDFDDGDLEAAVDYCSLLVLPSDIECFENIFIQKLFKQSLLDGPSSQKLNIVLLFDGFDEISPTYKTKTVKLLKCLRETNIKQLWITTRLHLKRYLELELGFPALMLNHFTNWDKVHFLNKFLKWHLKYREENLEIALSNLDAIRNTQTVNETTCVKEAVRSKCSVEYINYLIDLWDPSEYSWALLLKWQKAATTRKGNITSNPLHLRMLADVTFQRIENFNDNFNILTLYESFVTGSLNVFFREKKTLGTGLGGREQEIPLTTHYKKIHQELAVNLFGSMLNIEAKCVSFETEEENFNQYNYGPNEPEISVNQSLLRIGLLVLNSGLKLTFIHGTIAEYFLFEWLVSHQDKEEMQELFVNKILIQDHYILIGDFFEFYLGNTIQQTNQPTNHVFSEKLIYTISQLDLNEDSVLDIAAYRGHSNILNYLIGNFENYDLKYLKNCLMKRRATILTILHSAYMKKNAKCFKIILDLYGLYCEESVYFQDFVKILNRYFSDANNKEPENDEIILKDLISFARLKLCEENFKRLLVTPIRRYTSGSSLKLKCSCSWTIIQVMVYFKQESNLKFILAELQAYPFILRKFLLEPKLCDNCITPFDLALYRNYSNMVNVFLTTFQTNSQLLSAIILKSSNKYGITLQNEKILQNSNTIKDYLEIIGKYLSPVEYKRIINILVLSCNFKKEAVFAMLFNRQNDITNYISVTLLNKLELEELSEDILLISMYFPGMTAERQYAFLDWFQSCIIRTVHASNIRVLDRIKNARDNVLAVLNQTFSLIQKIRTSPLDKMDTIFLDEECEILNKKDLLLSFKLDPFLNILEFLLLNCEVKIVELVLTYLNGYPNILRTIVLDSDASSCAILHRLTTNSKTDQIKILLNNLSKFPEILKNLILKVNANEDTAAHLAVESKNEEILEILLNCTISIENGRDILVDLLFATNNGERNILELAIEQKDENIVKLILSVVDLLDIGYRIDLIFATYKHTKNVIFFCLKKSNREICILLLEYIIQHLNSSKRKQLFLESNDNSTIRTKVDKGNLIFAAVEQTEYPVLDILFKYIAIVFNNQDEYKKYILYTDSKQLNFLHIACRLGSSKNIESFLGEVSKFSNVETVVSLLLSQNNRWKMTPLHYAVYYNNFDSLKAVLLFCVDLFGLYPDLVRKLLLAVDKSGRTLLTLAIKKESLTCFSLLLFIVECMQKKQPGIIKELLLKTDMKRRTVLHEIITSGQNYMLDRLLETLVRSDLTLDELILNVDNDGETILHYYISDENLSNIQKILISLKNRDTVSQILTKGNKFGLTPLHKAYWKCDSKTVLENLYVQFLLKEIKEQNLDNRIYLNLQKASNIAQQFEDAIDSENLQEIETVLNNCQDCLKELFLMQTNSRLSFLRTAYKTKNIDVVKMIFQYLKRDSNLLKCVFLSNPILDYDTVSDFELFSVVLEYAKSIQDEKFFRHIILDDEFIIAFISSTKANKHVQDLLKNELNKIAESLTSPGGKAILEDMELRELRHLNAYIESDTYAGSLQVELISIIKMEMFRE